MAANIPWEAIEKWMLLHDNFMQAAKEFGVNEITIRSRARRHNWPLPSVIAKVAAARGAKSAQNGAIIESGVKNLAERGEAHAKTVFDLASRELAKVKRLPIRNWKDAEIADKTARRSAGMGNDDEGARISIIQLNEAIESHRADDDVIEAEATLIPDDPEPKQPEQPKQLDDASSADVNHDAEQQGNSDG